jgi:hypothetical protein
MKSLHRAAILALAAICLLAIPALSNHWDRGVAGIHHGGWLLLADDITEEQLDNMTLAEIRALKQREMQELQNMTLAEIRDLREQKRSELENMTLAEIQEKKQDGVLRGQSRGSHGLAGNLGGFGPAAEPEFVYGQAGCQMSGFAGSHGGMWMLLVDDATRNDLENMTLAQIDELRQQNVQELENMTLSEIRDLREQKMPEFENMTLAEFKEQRPQMNGHAGLFMGFSSAPGNEFQRSQARQDAGSWA